jgi:hypothetical protein
MQMEDDNSHASDGSDNAVPVADMLTFGHPTVKTAVATAATVAPDEPTPYEIREYRVADNAGIWGKIRVADTSVPDYRRARGILLHDLLAHVRTAADISRAVRRFEAVGHLAGIATRQEAESLLQHARRIVMERTIAKPTEGNYRPDRVVWTADGYVDVIDYKFGEEKPTQYGKQIRRYMQLLADMGHTPVRGFIWYVDSGRIVEVSD